MDFIWEIGTGLGVYFMPMNTTCIQGEHMSEAGLRIRMDHTLRRDFIETCRRKDTTAAQALRAFMRAYIEEHGVATRQEELFTSPDSPTGAQKRNSAKNQVDRR